MQDNPPGSELEHIRKRIGSLSTDSFYEKGTCSGCTEEIVEEPPILKEQRICTLSTDAFYEKGSCSGYTEEIGEEPLISKEQKGENTKKSVIVSLVSIMSYFLLVLLIIYS